MLIDSDKGRHPVHADRLQASLPCAISPPHSNTRVWAGGSNKQHALHFCSCCWCSWMCHRPSRYTRTALLPLSAARALLLILVQEFIAAILCSPSIVAFDLRGYNPRRIPIDRSAPRLRESKSWWENPIHVRFLGVGGRTWVVQRAFL